jgi:hypothetical protein
MTITIPLAWPALAGAELPIDWFWIAVVFAAAMAAAIGVNHELSERRWRRAREALERPGE